RRRPSRAPRRRVPSAIRDRRAPRPPETPSWCWAGYEALALPRAEALDPVRRRVDPAVHLLGSGPTLLRTVVVAPPRASRAPLHERVRQHPNPPAEAERIGGRGERRLGGIVVPVGGGGCPAGKVA